MMEDEYARWKRLFRDNRTVQLRVEELPNVCARSETITFSTEFGESVHLLNPCDSPDPDAIDVIVKLAKILETMAFHLKMISDGESLDIHEETDDPLREAGMEHYVHRTEAGEFFSVLTLCDITVISRHRFGHTSYDSLEMIRDWARGVNASKLA